MNKFDDCRVESFEAGINLQIHYTDEMPRVIAGGPDDGGHQADEREADE